MTVDNKNALEAGHNNQIELPSILQEILDIFKSFYLIVPDKIILNILIVKLAQMITAKRVMFDESGETKYPNWISIIYMASGFGKDRIVNDINKYLLKGFSDWFYAEAEAYYDSLGIKTEDTEGKDSKSDINEKIANYMAF